MKKLFIILILLALPAIVLCFDGSATLTNDIESTALTTSSIIPVETECNICGKTITYYSDYSDFGVDMKGVSGLVCHDCYEKYNQRYRDWRLKFFDYEKYNQRYRDWCLEFLDKVRAENKALRIKFKEERRLKAIQEKQDKIEALKKELEELKSPDLN